MAKAFLTKDKRVPLILRDAALLKRGEEKRHHFKLDIVLSEDPSVLNGFPDWIQNAYTSLIKTSNLATVQKFEINLENASLEMFPTPKGRRLFPIVNGVTLASFVMNRTGKTDEDAVVTLSFSAYFPGRKEIHDWVYDHKSNEFWASFEEAQQDLDFNDRQARSEEEGVDEDDDEAQLSLKEAAKEREALSASNVAKAKQKLTLM